MVTFGWKPKSHLDSLISFSLHWGLLVIYETFGRRECSHKWPWFLTVAAFVVVILWFQPGLMSRVVALKGMVNQEGSMAFVRDDVFILDWGALSEWKDCSGRQDWLWRDVLLLFLLLYVFHHSPFLSCFLLFTLTVTAMQRMSLWSSFSLVTVNLLRWLQIIFFVGYS